MGRKIAKMALWLETNFEAVIKDITAFLLEIPISLLGTAIKVIEVLNKARWPDAGILGGGGLIFGDGLPAPYRLKEILESRKSGLEFGADQARLKYGDSFELRGTTEVLTKETVAGQFGNDRRVLDADSLRRGVEAIYQNGEKARVYHVEREEEMLDMDFAYS